MILVPLMMVVITAEPGGQHAKGLQAGMNTRMDTAAGRDATDATAATAYARACPEALPARTFSRKAVCIASQPGTSSRGCGQGICKNTKDES